MPKFTRTIFFWFALGVWFIAPSPGRADDDERDCERASVQVALTTQRASGVVGTATLCVGENGVRGRIEAANLAPGHAYTVWFFYLQAGASSSPGRFDSAVVAEDEATFAGHVGMQLRSGSTVELLMFDHGMASSDPSAVALANQVLIPAGGSPVAVAFLPIP